MILKAFLRKRLTPENKKLLKSMEILNKLKAVKAHLFKDLERILVFRAPIKNKRAWNRR